MSDILKLLESMPNKIGVLPTFFISISIVALYFANELSGTDEVSKKIQRIIIFISGSLFALAVLIILLQMVSRFFMHRPARGLIDGLGVGLFSSLVGGFFGYGFHETYVVPGYLPMSYEPMPIRVGLCILFVVPVGGILGVLLDLIHPDRKINWREYAGALFLAVLILLLITGVGVSLFVPNMYVGLMLSDVQLLFEVFIVTMAFLMAFSLKWPIRKVAVRIWIVIMSVIIFRIPTFIFYDQSQDVLLYKRRFLREGTNNPGSIDRFLQDSMFELNMVIVFLMIWSLMTYGFYYKDYTFTRWLDRKVGSLTAKS